MKYTVVILDAEQRKAIHAADIKAWPKPWVLTAIFANSPCPYAVDWHDSLSISAARLARVLRYKCCIAATLVYRTPEVV
jgi:hypothetical protein